jgi:DNA-binding XRE family transcriptional regulator
MSLIKPLAETPETVTLTRADFDALPHAAEDAADLASVEAHRAYEDRVGWETARRNYLTADEARRLLDGISAVRVWREKRGMTQRALAEAAEVAVGYLAEIEGGKKPGSASALRRIAGVLDVPMENLVVGGAPAPGRLAARDALAGAR